MNIEGPDNALKLGKDVFTYINGDGDLLIGYGDSPGELLNVVYLNDSATHTLREALKALGLREWHRDLDDAGTVQEKIDLLDRAFKESFSVLVQRILGAAEGWEVSGNDLQLLLLQMQEIDVLAEKKKGDPTS